MQVARTNHGPFHLVSANITLQQALGILNNSRIVPKLFVQKTITEEFISLIHELQGYIKDSVVLLTIPISHKGVDPIV